MTDNTPTANRFIIKVQRPIATNDSYAHVLVYNIDRSVNLHTALKLVPAFGPDEYKYFAWARFNPPGHLIVDERAPWQDW